MGPRKSCAAFLLSARIVYECNFYCLVQTILVQTKDGKVYEKCTRQEI